ncbi:hypothetical protein B0H14DRAFT_2950607 [Mycena olivaceomarginata]|nr:hypothetical protein B0H14DRAFT_2950607 [Mycena olivaceomarginata]
MAAYDDVFGYEIPSFPCLIGAWLAAMLYGVVVTQAYQYFFLHPEDGMYRKFLVLSTVLFCTVALAADYANVYLPTVTFWGRLPFNYRYWPVPIFVTTSTFVGVLVNSFLIHRFYSMSKNLWISILLCLLLVTSFAGSVMVAITIQEFKLYTSRDKAKTAALIWTIATAATDIGIAGALVWQYFPLRARSKAHSRNFIRRVIIQTAQTGSTTSIVSIITLVTYLIKNDSNVPTACSFLIAPLYALTLLSNLKLRRRGHPATETNSIRMSGIIRFHHTTLETDDIGANPTRTEHAQYPNASIKNDTEPYGGNKVPDF